jgi:hypothetical protein
MGERSTKSKGVESDQRVRSCFSSEFTRRGGVARNKVIVSTKSQVKSTKSTTELVVSLECWERKGQAKYKNQMRRTITRNKIYVKCFMNI